MLVTGLGGTLAPHVAGAAIARGWRVSGWNRQEIPTGAGEEAAAFLERVRPDAIAHLALGDEGWAALLASFCAQTGAPYVLTSTAMVFDASPGGPHAPADARTARDDYGRSKIRCEDAVLAANAQASVVRLGWQIDADAHGNNMLAHLDAQQRRDGRITASRLWRPACSFMRDTAQALLALLQRPVAGVVHLDSNAEEGLPFPLIVAGLRQRFARSDWTIEVDESYAHDQRLIGGPSMPPLSTRLR